MVGGVRTWYFEYGSVSQTLRFDSLSIVHDATVTVPAWMASELTEQQAAEALLPVSDGYFRDSRGDLVSRTPFECLRDHLGYRMEVRQARYDRSELGKGRLPVEVDVVS